MVHTKRLILLFGVVATMLFLVAACGAPAEPQIVRETVVVEVEKEVEKVVTEVVEVITEVEKEVEVEVEKVVTEVVEVITEVEVEVEKEVVVGTRGQGGTVTVLYWQAASILNPYLSGGTKDVDSSSVVLEPLARYDENGNLVPWLVDEIPTIDNGGVSEDLTSITWTLREGILWSDGTPLTAEDVVFTGEYCMNEEMGCNASNLFADIDSIEAVDERTVTITFATPKPFPYGPFVGAISPIVQKAQFENCTGAKAQECTDENFGPIGTGAFKVTEFKANDVVVYEMNENYRDPNKPFFAEVIFKGGGDAAAAARAVLETGEADYAWNLQVEPQILNAMTLAGKGKVVNAFASNVERLMVNFTNPSADLGEQRSEWTADDPNPHPFLTDPAVRQALSLAIDRTAIATQLYGSAGKATCNVVPAPAAYVSTNNDDCLTQDVAAANALLDEAGWAPGADGIREKDGVRLSILYQTSTNSVRQSTQALIKQWWEAIGVETELRNIDAAVFFGNDPASPDTYGKFYADIEMYTNGFTGTDPENYMNSWVCEQVANASNQWLSSNIPRWCNDKAEAYQALVDELAKTAPLEDRAKLVVEMNDMLVQDGAMIPLVHRGSVSAHGNTLLGVRMNPWDSELWNIADWSRASQ